MRNRKHLLKFSPNAYTLLEFINNIKFNLKYQFYDFFFSYFYMFEIFFTNIDKQFFAESNSLKNKCYVIHLVFL